MLLMLSFLGVSLSRPTAEAVEEVRPPALNGDEAAQLPPSSVQVDEGLHTWLVSAIMSTYASVASSRLSSKVRSALSRAHGNPALPITSMQQPPVGPTSNASASEDSLLHVPSMVSQHREPQAVRLRLHVTPGHSGLNSTFLCHAISIDTPTGDQSRRRPASPVSLGETFINVSYQAIVALLIFHFQSTPGDKDSSTAKLPSVLLMAAEVAVVAGFAASLSGILLREVCWKVAAAIERVGSVLSAVGFFLMMGLLFSTSISKWIGVLCGGASLVVFVLPIINKKREASSSPV